MTMSQPVTTLPADFARRAGRAGAAAVTVPVPAADGYSELEVLAAGCVVLLRHSGQAELGVGLAGRSAPVRLLRIGLDPQGTYRQALAEVQRALAEPAARDEPGPAIWFRLPCLADAQRPASAADPGAVTEPAELVLRRAEQAVLLDYDPALFAASSAARLAQHLSLALAELARRPDSPLTRPLLPEPPPAGRWPIGQPVGELPPVADPVALFDRVAGEQPQRTALSSPSGALTFAELGHRTSWLAEQLRARGVGDGARVAVLSEHDLSGPIGVWSVLKAAAAYVPLDPRMPDLRLRRIITDAEVSAVLCSRQAVRRAQALARRLPVLQLDQPVPPDPPPNRDQPADPDAPAYLLFTSGSTGRPKGIVQSRSNLAAHARCYAERVGLLPGEQAALLAPITFDAAVMDLFGATLSGATLHVLDPLRPARDLRADLSERGITVLHGTPTLLRHLLSDAVPPGPDGPRYQPRIVVLGGEQVGGDDVSRLRQHFPAAQLVNGLGPTECTVALQHWITPDDADAASVPVGHPVPGVSVSLVDEAGAPAEVFGEMVLHSDRVALQYWKEAALTEAAFGHEAGTGRYFRTGDLAWRRPDGAFVFAGRRDRQVKVRGHRIEPGEIEAVLRSHPTVAQAAVVLDSSGPSTRLLAYATPATVFAVQPAELLDFLARHLPQYEVPGEVVPLEEMPLGPTGKIDRRRLPMPVAKSVDQAESQTETEARVLDIWRHALGTDQVDAAADFMANGGDSIQLMAMLAEVEASLRVRVELVDFLAQPTVAGLARRIEQAEPNAEGGMSA